MASTGFVPLASTALTGFEYDDVTMELEITFSSGDSFTFSPVPPQVVLGLMKADSPGRYFHRFIKGSF